MIDNISLLFSDIIYDIKRIAGVIAKQQIKNKEFENIM